MELLLNILLFIVLNLAAVFILALGLWAITLPFWALSQAFGASDGELKAQLAENESLLTELAEAPQTPTRRRKLPG